MKKLLHIALLSALAFSFTPMKAAVTDVKELYGTWTFYGTPTTEIPNVFPTTCEVTIGKNDDGQTVITNFAGNNKSLAADLFEDKLNVNGVNLDVTGDWWVQGSDCYYSNAESVNPFARDAQVSLEFTISDDGKKLTTDNFTIVFLDTYSNPEVAIDQATAIPMVTYTNCSLVWKEGESVDIADMSGNWQFEAGRYIVVEGKDITTNEAQYDEKSEFPITFDMKLTATSNEFTAYSAEITFPGYQPVTIGNVEFDGETMTFPINNTYIDQDKQIAFAVSENGPATLQGSFAFTKKNNNTLELKNYPFLCITKEGKTYQYYGGGTATKAVEGIDFSGTYTVTSGSVQENEGRLTDYTIPSTWQLKIEKAESGYSIAMFLDTDLSSIGMPISANVSAENPNVLEIPTVYSAWGDLFPSTVVDIAREKSQFLAIAASMDEQKEGDKITFTYNAEEGTYELSSYFLTYIDYSDAEKSGHCELGVVEASSAVKGTSGVKEADAAPAQNFVYAVNGTIVIAGEPTRVEVYSLTGTCVYDGITNEIGGLKRGYYLVRTGKNVNKVILK